MALTGLKMVIEHHSNNMFMMVSNGCLKDKCLVQVAIFRMLQQMEMFTAYSDERLTEDVKTIDNALDKVSKLRDVDYSLKTMREIGVIAQELGKKSYLS